AVAAISDEDVDRLIIADGSRAGRQPVPELIPLRVAQSTRGYEPHVISHYGASWLTGIEPWPQPTAWPLPGEGNRYLHGNDKPAFKSPLIVNGRFGKATRVTMRVAEVSGRVTLVIRANGAVVFAKAFEPGPGGGEWIRSEYRQRWGNYLAVYDRPYAAT